MTTWDEQTREEARQYAESKMPESWDRKDNILIPIFYSHFIDYIMEELRKSRCWARYKNWKEQNYKYSDYEDKWYPRAKSGSYEVAPFSPQYEEMEIRQEYIKLNNL